MKIGNWRSRVWFGNDQILIKVAIWMERRKTRGIYKVLVEREEEKGGERDTTGMFMVSEIYTDNHT